ncbi:MAG: valine--tRNA ligase [Bacteroidia bacterium]
MTTPKAYNPVERESEWYNYWLKNDLFSSKPDNRPPFVIVIPPPNVTGVLHMGHTLNNTIQDILIRRARMKGFNACWVPGTDHASIATEAKVVNLLKEQGLNKFEIGRDKFLEHAHDWKEKYGGIILEQLKKLGASCDWDRTAFTMDDIRYDAVIETFNALYEKGLIYRGTRMINWDPSAKTALSDEEVNFVERTDKLYYVNYKVAGSENERLTIATTRPETIMADTAVCINPNDERFTHLKGKKVIIPIVEREVPIIEDEYVDIEFGTGCLKITPAHDLNDHEIGHKHNLPIIDILNDDGTLNAKAQVFIGEDREIARKKVADLLKEKGIIVKIEDLTHNVGTSERTGAVIEPKLSLQWFCNMENLAKPALDMVMDDEVQFHPAKFKNTYRHWMENIKDWCISRQLWWGHRIPAWYLPNGEFVVAKNEKDALLKAQKIDAKVTLDQLEQDPDVLDTWFSSWLWPISVFDGIANPDNEEINYYYPTDVLVTGPDIIFFWVARMIMAGKAFRETKPFKHVYFTGIVRDDQGRKMSKQLGNSPDLLKLIDHYGADSVRFGIMISSPAGNDLLFSEKLCDQGSAFINKIWNAHNLTKSWIGFDKIVDDADDATIAKNQQAAKLFESKLTQSLKEIETAYEKFKLSEVLQSVYRLIWTDFCSNYLEWVKPRKDTVIDRAAYERTLDYFETCLKLLHPLMPFVTEELYHMLKERKDGQSICVEEYPKTESFNSSHLKEYKLLDALISDARNYKVSQKMSLGSELDCQIISSETAFFNDFNHLIKASAGISISEITDNKPEGKQSFLSGTSEIFNMGSDTKMSAEEVEETKSEIKRLEGFLKGIEKKLSNERFVNNAPEQVVTIEKKKQADTIEKITSLKEKLERVNN